MPKWGIETMYKKKIMLSLALAVSFLATNQQNNVKAEEVNDQNIEFKSTIPEGYYDEVLEGQKDTAEYIKNMQLENQKLTNSDVETFAVPIPDGSMGNTGDILYTPSGFSSTSLPVGGHAAIVVDRYSTIEAMGLRQDTDGVRYWTNNFKERYKDARAYTVIGATASQKQSAVNNAKYELYDPYNYSFYEKTRTDAFYCSQLVWRAWYDLGVELDYNGGTAVWPIDLTKGSKVKAI